MKDEKWYDPEYDRYVTEDVIKKQYEYFKKSPYFKKTYEQFREENFMKIKDSAQMQDTFTVE